MSKALPPLCLLFLVFLLFMPLAIAQPSKAAVLIPLSGAFAEYGVAMRNGVELAKQDQPTLFKYLDLIYEDTGYNNMTAVTLVNKFASTEAPPLIYLFGYGLCQAAAPIAEARKLPIMAVTGEQEVNIGKRYVLRFCYRMEQFSNAILGYVRAHNLKRIGIVKIDMAYVNGIVDGMLANQRPDESIEIVDSLQISEGDFKSLIAKLKTRKFDILGVLLATGQVSEFYKQAHILGFKMPTFGASFFESHSEIAKAGGLMEGAVFPGIDVSPGFQARYMKEYGNDIQIGWAANSYDFALMAATIASHSPKQSLSPVDFLDQFKKISDFQGAEGKICYREDSLRGSGLEFQIVMKRIENNTFSVIPESRGW